MTRVPTYASQQSYIRRMLSSQSSMANSMYQVVTEYKSPSYSGYSVQTWRILNFEAEVSRSSKFIETNTTLNTRLSAMEKSLESLQSSMSEFRSALLEAADMDLKNLTPDYYTDPPKTLTADKQNEIARLQQAAFSAMKDIEFYLNIKAEGQYLFSGGKNNIAPVKIPYDTLEELQKVYDGLFVTAPTTAAAHMTTQRVDGNTTGGVSLEQRIRAAGVDNLGNLIDIGTVTFDPASNTISAPAGTFDDLEARGIINLSGTFDWGTGNNDGDYIIQEITEVGGQSIIHLDERTRLQYPPIPEYTNGLNPLNGLPVEFTSDGIPPITRDGTETGTLVFDAVENKVTGQSPNSFSDFQVGDKITIANSTINPYGDPVNNDKTYVIKSISSDGKEMVFEPQETLTPPPVPSVTSDIPTNTGVQVTQNLYEGVIDAVNQNGYVVSTLTVPPGLNVEFNVAGPNSITVDTPDYFQTVTIGQTVKISNTPPNDGYFYVTDISADGRTLTFSEPVTTLPPTAAGGITFDLMSAEHGFVGENIVGSPSTTGTLYFDSKNNQITSANKNVFNHLQPGSTIVVNGTANNNGVKYVTAVSEDGRTITLSDETPLVDEPDTFDPARGLSRIVDGSPVNIGVSYPIGSTIDMSDIDPRYNGKYTVIGVEEGGNRLIVKTDDFPKYPEFATLPQTYLDTGTFQGNSYYQGDFLAGQYRTSENTTMTIDVNAEDAAFEKALRALMEIAQGNFVDTRQPLEALDGIDLTQSYDRVMEALNLMDDALEHNNITNPSEGKSDIKILIQTVSLNQVSLNKIMGDQTYYKTFLQNAVDGIEKIDPLTAAAELEYKSSLLQASYSAMSRVVQLSLLNYLR